MKSASYVLAMLAISSTVLQADEASARPNLPGAIEWISDSRQLATELANRGELHAQEHNWKLAADCWKQVASIYRELYGNDSALTAEALERLGRAHKEICEWEDAIVAYEEALSIRTSNSGGESLEVAHDLEALGLIQFEQNCNSSAEPLFERHVAMMRRLLGDDCQSAAFAEFLIGVCHMRRECHFSAIAHFERALSTFRKSSSDDASGIEPCLAALSFEHLQVGDPHRSRSSREELALVRLRRLGLAIADDDLDQLPAPLPANFKLPMTASQIVEVLERFATKRAAMGEWDRVRSAREQIAGICRKDCGNDAAATADAMQELGRALIELKEWNEARAALLQSLSIRDSACCGIHRDSADNLELLIHVELQQRNVDGAVVFLEQRAALFRGLYGSNDQTTIRAMVRMGDAYRQNGDHDSAISSFESALAAMQSSRRTGDPDFEACLKVLCAEYVHVRDFEHARPLAKKLVDAFRLRQHPSDPNDLKQLVELGSLHFITKDVSAARSLFEEALPRLVELVGTEHPVVENVHWNLGMCLQIQGIADGAIAHIGESLRIREAIHGELSTESAEANAMLGRLQMEAGNYLPALVCFEQALEIEEKLVLKDDLVMGDIHTRVGQLLLMAELPKSLQHLDCALQIRRVRLGSDHAGIAEVLHLQGDCLSRMGYLGAARPRYDEALQIRRRRLGNRHLDTANTLANLGALLLRERNHTAARLCLEEALDIRRLRLGDDHAETRRLIHRLGELPAPPRRETVSNVSAD